MINTKNLHGYHGVATTGEFEGCDIDVTVVANEIVLFAITGTPKGSAEPVAFEASATDEEGIEEWFDDFGLAMPEEPS